MGENQNGSMPLSMQMALAHNTVAMQAFLKLDDSTQDKIIEEARNMETKREIQKLVDNIPGIRLN